MGSLMESLKERADRVRNLLTAGSRTATESVFYHACRIQDEGNGNAVKYRVTILVRSQNLMEAEEMAEAHLEQILKQPDFVSSSNIVSGSRISVRWLKGRLLSSRPREDESEATLQLLNKLQRGTSKILSSIERVGE